MKLKLTVDGKLYEVEVEVAEPEQPQPGYVPPLAASAAGAPPSGGPPASGSAPSAPAGGGRVVDEGKVCRSPISGVVVRVSAELGQAIQTDDVLMLLEAMKMETVITSPIAGTIAKINVKAGDSVQAGQVLVEFE